MLSLLLCISLVLGRAVQLGAAPPPPPPPPTPPPPPPPDPQRCTCQALPRNCINATTCNTQPCFRDCKPNATLAFDPPPVKSAAVHETLMTFGPPTLAMTLAGAAYTNKDNVFDATIDIQIVIWKFFSSYAGTWCSYTTPSVTYGSVIWVGIKADSFGVENLMYLYWLEGTNPGMAPLPPIPTLPEDQPTVTLVLAIRGTSTAGADENLFPQPTYVFPAVRNASVTCGYKTAADRLLIASDPRYVCPAAPCTIESFLRYLKEQKGNSGITLQIAGHSLGGAVAPLVALYLQTRVGDILTITNVWGFAAPAIGNFDYRQALQDYIPNIISLYRNPLDILPYLFGDFTPITSLYQRWNSCPCQRDCDLVACIRYCTQDQPWSQPLYYHPLTNQLNNLPADINVNGRQAMPDSTQSWEYNLEIMHNHERYVSWMYKRSCTRP